MRLKKVLDLANVLAKSQLRAASSGQLGASFFRRSTAIFILDIAVFAVSATVGYLFAGAVSLAPEPYHSQLQTAYVEGLVLVPLLIPAMVLLPGILFELSVSSKFASSDTVNWLPVTQSEYATASSLSVAYIYSIIPSIVFGFTLTISRLWGIALVWADMFVLGVISLLLGSVLVEILRAAINRVSSAVMKRARKGALLLRLVVTVLVIVMFQFVFNFIFLLQIITGFSSVVGSVQAIPIFWASLSVKYLLTGDVLLSFVFFLGTIGFTLAMLLAAAKVRARYWVPVPMTVAVTHAEYKPVATDLYSRLGFSMMERAIIKKDLKGLVRRRDLIQFFAIPVVFTVVILFQNSVVSQGGSATPGITLTFPIFFVSSIFSLIISSMSFGQEGKAVINIYSLPITPGRLLRAKACVSLFLSLSATIGLFVVISLVKGVGGTDALLVLVTGVVLTVEVNFVGLGFGTRYPDFQERPRPRFVEPIAIILAIFLGLGLTLVGALPIILNAVLPSLGPWYYYLIVFSMTFSVAFTLFAYKWASSGVRNLLAEMRA